MNNLLVVDDDYLIVNSIKSAIDITKLHIADIYTATSIAQAKDILQRHPVDIMICDIEMPQGSGLELLEWTKLHMPEIDSVVLTGHANFEYAMRALKLGCMDYILKPVSFEELEESIHKIIHRDNNTGAQNKKYDHFIKNYKSLAVKRFWKDILNENIPANMQYITRATEEREIPFAFDMKALPILVNLHDSPQTGTVQSIERMQKISQIIRTDLLDTMVGQILTIREGSFLILLFDIDDKHVQGLYKKCEDLLQTCLDGIQLEISCYIGQSVYIDRLAFMYIGLISLAKSNNSLLSRVFILEDTKARTDYKSPDLSVWTMLLKQGAKEEIIDEVRDYLEEREREDQVDRDYLRRFNMDFIQIICSYLEGQGIHANYIVNDEISQDLFAKATNGIDNTVYWVRHIVDKLMIYMQEIGTFSPIEKAKRYIEEHYTEELHRKDIENNTYVNVDYLNRIFKKETGSSLMDYVLHLRMDAAKDLLVKTSLSIGEISEKVGYNSISNFSTMFKKYLGMSPNEYRNLHNNI